MEFLNAMKILLTYLACTGFVTESAMMHEVKELISELLDGYDRNILPIKNQSAEFNVEAIFELRAISDLDELQERLTTVMYLTFFWTDESMMWNDTENDIFFVTMDADFMWKPRIAVTNAHASSQVHRSHDWDICEYLYNGKTRWMTLKTFETTCELDTRFYPFDLQRCSIEIFIYGYYGSIKFIPLWFEDTHLQVYQPQGTWNVTDYYISNKDGSNITLTYHLKRNPRYVIVNFLTPLLVLALLNPMVFLLAADSGERIGYSMTIMLALSVYMTLLGEYLPPSSNPIPLMSYTIMIWYLLSATTLLILFVSSHLFHKSNRRPVPQFLQCFVRVIRLTFCIDCMKTRDDDIYDKEETDGCLDDGETAESKTIGTKQNRRKSRLICCKPQCYTKANREVTWQHVSKALDLFFMVFIYVVKILFAVIFMHMLSMRPELERVIRNSTNFA